MGKIRIVESDHTRNEHDILGGEDLRNLLCSLVQGENRVIIMELPNIGIFTLGVGEPYGFVQFSKNDEPPYLIAPATGNIEGADSDSEVEFDAGGTPTPIPISLCLPFYQVVDIIVYCFENQELPQYAKWKAV